MTAKTAKITKPAKTTYAKAVKAAAARDLSQFYTDPQIAAVCVAVVTARYGAGHFYSVIEPSAGKGAFSHQLGADCIALDLDPKAPGIEKADFLKWQPVAPTGRCLVIGNPPFGKKAALDFLNHAAAFADVIAFILPTTFCKKTQQNRVAKTLHLVHEEEVPAHAFTFEGKTTHVACVLQIWERRPEERVKHKLKTRHPHFERCTQDKADLVIRRIGAHAGQLKPLEKSWSAESNIFLRATGCSAEALKDRFARLDLASLARNGAGGGSINMSEIVELYDEALAEEARTAAAGPAMLMLRQIVQNLPTEIETPAPTAQERPAAQTEPTAEDDMAAPVLAVERGADTRHLVIEASIGEAPSKLAVARFNAAAAQADSITLTVPLSFRKMSVQNQLDPSFHLVEDTDSVIETAGANGRPHALPCAIQTWVRRSEPRPRHRLAATHADFVFCDRAEADVAIQRVGSAAGRLKTPTEAGSAQSHVFLKAVRCSPAELRARLETIDFDTVRHNTAAVPSVAKTEIVALYEATRSLVAAAFVSPDERAPALTSESEKPVRHEGSAPRVARNTGAMHLQALDRSGCACPTIRREPKAGSLSSSLCADAALSGSAAITG